MKMSEMCNQEADSKHKDGTGMASSKPTGVSCEGIFRFLK